MLPPLPRLMVTYRSKEPHIPPRLAQFLQEEDEAHTPKLSLPQCSGAPTEEDLGVITTLKGYDPLPSSVCSVGYNVREIELTDFRWQKNSSPPR